MSYSIVPHPDGELVDYSLEDALRCFIRPSLQEQVEELGLPEEVSDYVFVQSPSKYKARELTLPMIAKLAEHGTPSASQCFEAVANLEIASDHDLASLAGLRLLSAGKSMLTVDGIYHERKRFARRKIEVLQGDVEMVQRLAAQLAGADDVAEVELTADEAERLRSLARLHMVWAGRIEQKVRLMELESTPWVRVGGSTLFHGVADLSLREEGHWLADHDVPSDPYFHQNWIVVRAMDYLVSYCLGLEKGHIRRCGLPHGLVAQTDYEQGLRDAPPGVCGTFFVAPRKAINCGKSTCQAYQTSLGWHDD